jgi:hypothetical protein
MERMDYLVMFEDLILFLCIGLKSMDLAVLSFGPVHFETFLIFCW